MKLSPLGTLVVTIGALAGILIWVVAFIGLPNASTHRNMADNPKVATSAASSNSTDAGTSGNGTGGSGNTAANQGGSGSTQAPQQLVTLPPKDPSAIKLIDTDMPGYQLFEQTCAACHGKSAEGGVGPAIYAIGKYWNTSQITAFVEQGRGVMPAKGGLPDDGKVQQVVAWLSKQTG